MTLIKGVSIIYTVAKVADLLSLSQRTVQRDIASMSEDIQRLSLTFPTSKRHRSLTEYGLQWLANKHNITLDGVATDGEEQTKEAETSENEIIISLLEQLRQKDLQIAEKDKQIAQLMEQAKNFQVLLQTQQVLSLTVPKQSFFKRLFARKENIDNE